MEVVVYLISVGATFDHTLRFGYTALMICGDKGYYDVAAFLANREVMLVFSALYLY